MSFIFIKLKCRPLRDFGAAKIAPQKKGWEPLLYSICSWIFNCIMDKTWGNKILSFYSWNLFSSIPIHSNRLKFCFVLGCVCMCRSLQLQLKNLKWICYFLQYAIESNLRLKYFIRRKKKIQQYLERQIKS